MAYGSDQGFETWLADNGYALPDAAPAPAVLRRRGSTYIDATYEARLPGYRTGGLAQMDAWPRAGATAFGQEIPADLVPPQVIEASYQAAWFEANNPGGLVAGGSAMKSVKRQKVGEIEREFFGSSDGADFAGSITPLISTVDGLLAPFLAGSITMPAILVV